MSSFAASGMSTSWIRPTGADAVGVPNRLYYTATQSALGTQLKSTRPTASAFSVPKTDAYRSPGGLRNWHENKTPNLYLGEAHQIHVIPPTPGVGAYGHRTSVGKQALSRNKNTASFSFGTTERFAYVDRTIRKNATPGPGTYIS